MTLPDYFSTLSAADQAAFRDRVIAAASITKPAWYHWLAGRARPSQRHALLIHKLSNNQVTLRDLRPGDYA